MYLCVILSFLLIRTVKTDENADLAISRTGVVDFKQYPYMAHIFLLTNSKQQHFGTGTIISEDSILTASENLYQNGEKVRYADLLVVVGSTFSYKVASANILRRNGLSVLILAHAMSYNTKIQPIKLLSHKMLHNRYPSEVFNDCKAVGWFRVKNDINSRGTPDTLKFLEVDMPLIPKGECNGKRKYLCVRGVCLGQAGTPLICDKTLVAVLVRAKNCRIGDNHSWRRIDGFQKYFKYANEGLFKNSQKITNVVDADSSALSTVAWEFGYFMIVSMVLSH